jgi:hypothetical protein
MRTSARIHESVGAVSLSLLALAMLMLKPGVVHAGSAPSLPPDDHLIVKPSDWLDGHGVGVYYTSHPDDDHPQNSDGRIQYECVELVFRWFDKLGYPPHWPITNTAEIIYLPGMAGFADLVFVANDATTPPRPGDVAVWPGWYNAGTGHVAVINRVEGDEVQVVHQNVWRHRRPFPFTSLVLLQSQPGHYRLMSRDGVVLVGWIHSPRTEGWLDAVRLSANAFRARARRAV